MKFSVASILALATVTIAAPTKDHGGDTCKYVTFVNDDLIVVKANVDLDLLGLLDLDLDLVIKIGLLGGECKAVYCCDKPCDKGEHVPDTCRKYEH
ncbi:hypothetical protein MHUMG1_07471 [Metarhizium humberi]|uniref:Hydrophobin n=1 Tax=Metarhizium humberi TaxID=2596975 RepID=A0A9P8M6H0_9HYPO|nr:hypothetical protein MHUMG1_07471 [Metarhizium humberi]